MSIIALEQAKKSSCFLRTAQVTGLPVEEVHEIHVKIVGIRQAANARAHAEESATALRLSQRQSRSRITNVDELIIATVPSDQALCEAVRLLACYMDGRQDICLRLYRDKVATMLLITERLHPQSATIVEYLRGVREYFMLVEAAPPPGISPTACHAAT